MSRSALPCVLLGLLALSAHCCVQAAESASAPEGAASSAALPPIRDIMVVFDTTMEHNAMVGPNGAESKALVLTRSIDKVSAQIKAWGVKHGVSIDTAHFNSKSKIDLQGRTYRHLLMEKITMEGFEDTPQGQRFSGRQWDATTYRMDVPKDKPMPKLGHEVYKSDELDCFGVGIKEKDAAACQGRWLNTLSKHLQWANPAWPSLSE